MNRKFHVYAKISVENIYCNPTIDIISDLNLFNLSVHIVNGAKFEKNSNFAT